MKTIDYPQLLDELKLVARDAGREIMKIYESSFDVNFKGDGSPVTLADEAAEKVILSRLKKITPDIPIVAEEHTNSHKLEASNQFFLIDPLDGTTNYIHGFPYYAISIAYVEKGKTLHALTIDVSRQDEYTASLGRGAYLNDRRIRVSKRNGVKGALLSNSSHDTD